MQASCFHGKSKLSMVRYMEITDDSMKTSDLFAWCWLSHGFVTEHISFESIHAEDKIYATTFRLQYLSHWRPLIFEDVMVEFSSNVYFELRMSTLRLRMTAKDTLKIENGKLTDEEGLHIIMVENNIENSICGCKGKCRWRFCVVL